ncbi:hypothetical protein GGR42_002497 [Saonia flava]|uniref:Uncharacterized protein n=1 Tax=Saonia flava TaxID=523696 RepID=A0A846QSQ9_9FLAO|nr:hypothetical protein [Saonia flava]NJB72006.1 hypothetical protein [Saonia flava]
MELDNIEKLLEKYFEATATVAEEKTLRAYFTNENIAPHLEQYAPMFQYFSIAKEEEFTKQVSVTKVVRTRKVYYKWISVAAVTLLMFGIYFGKNYQEQKQAEYAYNETKKALNLLADNFGKGTEKMAYLNEFGTTTQKIYNNK